MWRIAENKPSGGPPECGGGLAQRASELLRTERRAIIGCAMVLVTIISLLRGGTPAMTAVPVAFHVALILTMLVRFESWPTLPKD